ncbi:SSS family solute:Na+ symporter, partial [Aureobasidium melanogenum]
MAEVLLNQAHGYGIIIGLSILFCLIILAAVRVQKRYLSEDSEQSEMFMVANRSVGTGLTASAVFSSWMWINESVICAAYTYKWGVALPIWWASGLSFQIALMAVLGIVAKLRVPYAHTSLEFMRMRYGKYAHWIFIVLNLINNIFGCGSMILAGAQLVTGITGMHIVAACILIPAGAVLFGLVLKLGNLALVLMDTAFWQKSFASEVESVVPAYDLVSVVILAVPWCTGTIIGLSGRAIEKTPIWFDYPNLLTEKQVNSGLVMPYVLRSLLGKGATSGLLVLIFMAITSTVSSSVIAVSSIISQDFYRSYINPKASDRKILKVSHFGVVGHGCFMAGFAIMLQYAGATNNWSTYFRPIVACPGIFPLILTLLWSRQTKAAAILSPVLGLAAGIATWLSLSYVWGGKINIQTTQEQLPGLYGALVSFFSPALFSVIISLVRPSKFDWRVFLKIDLIEDNSQPNTSLPSPQDSKEDVNKISQISRPAQQPLSEKDQIAIDAESKAGLVSPASSFSARTGSLDDISHPFSEQTIRHIKKWRTYAAGYFVVNLLVTVVLWPVPMYRDYIFTVPFFKGWIVMAIIWHFAAMMAVIVYPIWDGRHVINTVLQGVRKQWTKT